MTKIIPRFHKEFFEAEDNHLSPRFINKWLTIMVSGFLMSTLSSSDRCSGSFSPLEFLSSVILASCSIFFCRLTNDVKLLLLLLLLLTLLLFVGALKTWKKEGGFVIKKRELKFRFVPKSVIFSKSKPGTRFENWLLGTEIKDEISLLNHFFQGYV